MLNVIHQFETSTVLFFVTICFVAGFIKGIVGFAMPMIILGCSAALGMPLLGLAVLIMPTLVTNIYQVSLFGKAELVKSIRDFRFFYLHVWLDYLLVQICLLQPILIF